LRQETSLALIIISIMRLNYLTLPLYVRVVCFLTPVVHPPHGAHRPMTLKFKGKIVIYE